MQDCCCVWQDARRGCYISVGCELSGFPSVEVRERYVAMLTAAFAGSDGLKVLLDQASLIVARVRQPDIIHVVVGEGREGKTLIFLELMRAVWGTGFANCPASMLQVEREFQQQGANFIHAVWMVFDECRREGGLVEEVAKNFIGGGQLPLRKNHAQETTYGSWPFTGKCWCMNTADIPCLPSAQAGVVLGVSDAKQKVDVFIVWIVKKVQVTLKRSEVN